MTSARTVETVLHIKHEHREQYVLCGSSDQLEPPEPASRDPCAMLAAFASLALLFAPSGASQASNFHDVSSVIGPPLKYNFTFETVTGYFLQDLNSTNASTFDVISQNFGLIDTSKKNHWEVFRQNITRLNKKAPRDVSYHVLYLARHGEGFHNTAEAFYGTPAWDDYYSKIDGNGTVSWGPDALLTDKGKAQAANVSVAWKAQAKLGVPLPQSFYSSPLSRSMDTLNITWADWRLKERGIPQPVVLEGLRETIGVHTCDMRRTSDYIHGRYPKWFLEKGFSEEDKLWLPDVRETSDQQQARAREALVEILNGDDSTYISITSHSGETSAMLRAIGHRAFSLQTGGFLPVVLKATRVPSKTYHHW